MQTRCRSSLRVQNLESQMVDILFLTGWPANAHHNLRLKTPAIYRYPRKHVGPGFSCRKRRGPPPSPHRKGDFFAVCSAVREKPLGGKQIVDRTLGQMQLAGDRPDTQALALEAGYLLPVHDLDVKNKIVLVRRQFTR